MMPSLWANSIRPFWWVRGGTKLRIAGQCDAGSDCTSITNPLMEFGALPDGGVW